jgi:hypothetical protein
MYVGTCIVRGFLVEDFAFFGVTCAGLVAAGADSTESAISLNTALSTQTYNK